MKSLNFLLILTILSIYSISSAQNTKEDFLAVHNKARAEVGVDPLKWTNTLSNYGQKYAKSKIKDCELEHSYGPYGENLAWGSSDMTAIDVEKMWVGEKVNFDHKTKNCPKLEDCGHYTHVVWRATHSVRCAKARCNSGGTFIICNYYPPGNYVDESPY